MPNILKNLFCKHKSSNIQPSNKYFNWCACTRSRTTSIVELPTKNLEYLKSKILSESILLTYQESNNNVPIEYHYKQNLSCKKPGEYLQCQEPGTMNITTPVEVGDDKRESPATNCGKETSDKITKLKSNDYIDFSSLDTSLVDCISPSAIVVDACSDEENLEMHTIVNECVIDNKTTNFEVTNNDIESISSIEYSSVQNITHVQTIISDPVLLGLSKNENSISHNHIHDVALSTNSLDNSINNINFSELSIKYRPKSIVEPSTDPEPNYHDKSCLYYHHNDISLYYQLRSLSKSDMTPDNLANIVSDYHNANDNAFYNSDSSELSCY